MALPTGPSKQEQRAGIREAVLAECDTDIREVFAGHWFTMEPLLMQLIREVRRLPLALAIDREPLP